MHINFNSGYRQMNRIVGIIVIFGFMFILSYLRRVNMGNNNVVLKVTWSIHNQ